MHVQGVHRVVPKHMEKQAHVVAPRPAILCVQQSRVPHVFQQLHSFLHGHAAFGFGDKTERQHVEPLPVQVLDRQEAVPPGHGRLAQPLGVVRIPMLVVLGPVAADHEPVFVRSQSLLLLRHARLLHHASGHPREDIERVVAGRQLLRLLVQESEADQLVLQRRVAAKLLYQQPARFAVAPRVLDDRHATDDLGFHGCRAVGPGEEERHVRELGLPEGRQRRDPARLHLLRRGVLAKHLDHRVQRAILEALEAEAGAELGHVNNVYEQGVHIVVAENVDE
mmetsp:Transcript_33992/g.102665  ORF Transcript_33992/g.102665 Transcript_33992/m.102665 type:complete len:280 (-) Transcript_33992:653-1492(-)